MGETQTKGKQKGLSEDSIYPNKRKLYINKQCGLGRKLEKTGEFAESYFRNNYYDAFWLTQEILERTQKAKENWKLNWHDDKDIMEQEKLYNIIIFCGGRGTGKTSVMHSVIEALRCKSEEFKEFIIQYEQKEKKSGQRNPDGLDVSQLLDEYQFACLDGIDASLLEEKEDILDVILSKMLQRLQKKMDGYDKNHLWGMEAGDSYSRGDIYRKFEEICHNRRRFSGWMDNRYDVGESSAEQLNSLAGSMGIRRNLQELVRMYLQALGMRGDKESQYLVIGIDDLDMHGNAYGMLEQLHRYLMIPQVIIYIAVSDREIQSVCEKHFAKMYDRPAELAMSYLEKVLPYSQRIYLPSTYNGDFFNIIVDELNPEKTEYSIKEYLLREIARKTHVFYSSQGPEAHFYEIGNLRTLYNMHYLLKSMKEIEKEDLRSEREALAAKDGSYREILDINIDKLRNDVIGRMAMEKLSDEGQQIFRKYYQEDFSSNAEYLVGQIAEILKEEEFAQNYQTLGYSYGELIHALYCLGKRKQEFKPLIQCLLALATIELTQNYIYAFHVKDKSSQMKWEEYISGTVCGGFGNRLLPKVKEKEEVKEDGKAVSYVKDCIIYVSIPLPGREGKELQSNGLSEDDKYNICVSLLEDEGYKFVESFELFMMFLSKKEEIGAEKYNISMEKTHQGFAICLKDWECTFDIFGFAVYSMEGEAYFERVDEMIFQMMKSYCCADSVLKPEKEKILLDKIKEKSLRKKYESWDKDHSGMALPIYSLDIMYNILKKAKKELERKLPKAIAPGDFLQAIVELYKSLEKLLELEDDFYNRVGKSEKEGKEEPQKEGTPEGDEDDSADGNAAVEKDDQDKIAQTNGEEGGKERDYSDFLKAYAECPFIQPFIKDGLPEMFRALFNYMILELIKE